MTAQQERPLDRLAATCRRWGYYGIFVAVVGVALAIFLPASDLWWTCAIIGVGIWLMIMGYWGVTKVRRQIQQIRGAG